jgi:tRNA nucleotidyltransferase (CCA-adding enzyme)
MKLPAPTISLSHACERVGGRAWLVGGLVRDSLIGIASKDIDIEVHGIDLEPLQQLLRELGTVNAIGKNFGVYKVVIDGVPMDVSIPRRDSQQGTRHNDVLVQGDPHMGIEEAARRRDLTINAIAYDPLSSEYCDPFGGIQDIERGRLRAVDPSSFMEDPLRVLRVVQFAARFGFGIHDSLMELCRSAHLTSLPAERIWGEIEKMLMRSPAPSIGWEAGVRTGALAQVLPEAAAQRREAIEAALDRAAELRETAEHPGRATALMVAAMLHCGSVDQAEQTCERLKLFKLHGYPVRKRVLEAVAHWRTLCEPMTTTELRALAEEAELLLCGSLAWSASGRSTALANIDSAVRLGIAEAPMPQLISGRDLTRIGIAPGPALGEYLAQVRAAQITGDLQDKDQAIAWVQTQAEDA